MAAQQRVRVWLERADQPGGAVFWHERLSPGCGTAHTDPKKGSL